MWLLAGLGNPGARYETSRHNVGFMAIDELHRQIGAPAFRDQFGSAIALGNFAGHKVLLQKPMEYMNNSGYAISRAVQYYKIAVNNLLVLHDELDIEFSQLRLKSGGGHGGHNGLRSIIGQLSSPDFLRIRIGVGAPKSSTHDGANARTTDKGSVVKHVLGDFNADECNQLDDIIKRTLQAAECIITDGITPAMNNFNGKAARK